MNAIHDVTSRIIVSVSTIPYVAQNIRSWIMITKSRKIKDVGCRYSLCRNEDTCNIRVYTVYSIIANEKLFHCIITVQYLIGYQLSDRRYHEGLLLYLLVATDLKNR